MVVEKWICDKCNETIEKAENGRLKWTRNMNDDTLSNFKIIHHPSCRKAAPKSHSYSLAEPGDPLDYFLGEDGLIRLLELMAQTVQESQSNLLEIIQRLRVPGYESARFNFNKAKSEGHIIPPIHGVYYPSMEKIREINEEYADDTE